MGESTVVRLARELARQWIADGDVIEDDAPVWDASYDAGFCHTCAEWVPAIGVLISRDGYKVPATVPFPDNQKRYYYLTYEDNLPELEGELETYVQKCQREWNKHLSDIHRRRIEEECRELERKAQEAAEQLDAEARSVHAAFPYDPATPWDKLGELIQSHYQQAAVEIRKARSTQLGAAGYATIMPMQTMKEWAQSQRG